MSDPIIIFLLGRIFERTLMIIGGLLSLWFGFRLFRIVPIDSATAELQFQSFSFKAGRIAPGIFFALFGATLLGYLAFSKLYLSSEVGDTAKAVSASKPSIPTKPLNSSTQIAWGSMSTEDPDAVPVKIKALNTIMTIRSAQRPNSEIGIQESRLFYLAAPSLETYLQDFIDAKYGPGAYAEHKAIERACDSGNELCTESRKNAEDRKRLDAITADLAQTIEAREAAK